MAKNNEDNKKAITNPPTEPDASKLGLFSPIPDPNASAPGNPAVSDPVDGPDATAHSDQPNAPPSLPTADFVRDNAVDENGTPTNANITHRVPAVEANAPPVGGAPRKPKHWEPPYIHLDPQSGAITHVSMSSDPSAPNSAPGNDPHVVHVGFANKAQAQHFHDSLRKHVKATPAPAAAPAAPDAGATTPSL
jgi:hypothetical protein